MGFTLLLCLGACCPHRSHLQGIEYYMCSNEAGLHEGEVGRVTVHNLTGISRILIQPVCLLQGSIGPESARGRGLE